MNIFKKWREYRAAKRKKKELRQTSRVFGHIEQLTKSHMLIWELKDRRLFIAQPLAMVMLSRGTEAWRNFLNNVYLYHVFCLQQQQWDQYVLDLQRKAVAERVASGIKVKPGELDRIRRAVRDGINKDGVSLPPIEAFDFYIIADNASGDAQAEITFVGEYNPETRLFDMASWEEVKAAVQEAKKNTEKE